MKWLALIPTNWVMELELYIICYGQEDGAKNLPLIITKKSTDKTPDIPNMPLFILSKSTPSLSIELFSWATGSSPPAGSSQ